MLGFVTIADIGAADRLLTGIAQTLQARGLRLAGAVQANIDRGPDRVCDMELAILGRDQIIGITQNLGSCAEGCRLDTAALATAVAQAEAVLAQGADLVIVNKFGKQEGFGRGFRDFIGQALAQGIPVLLSVPPEQLPQFQEFAGDMAQAVVPAQALDWCHAQLGDAA